MELEVKKSEFLDYLSWLFIGLCGDQVLMIVNLNDPNDIATFTWKAVVNDRDQTNRIVNKIKLMINVEITLETYTELGTLRRKCSYRNGLVTNDTPDVDNDPSVTAIDLMFEWGDA
jgi:hypothetical protein